MWDEFPEIRSHLLECLALIKKKTTIRNKQIQEAIFSLLDNGGKLLRPAFFMLFSKLGDVEKQNHHQLISAAASTEVLHLGTLIHDDIIDDSDMRRGSQTLQSKYGKDVAVYAGDLLLSVYFDLLADTTKSTKIIKKNAFSMRRVLLGELEQLTNAYNVHITYRQYIRNIKGKTAQLFELSCFEGAYYGKASPDVVKRSGRVGNYIGIAFQMLDDILDYSQTIEEFEKPVLEDVKQGIYSLPLILAMQENRQPFLPLLEKKHEMTESDVKQVVSLIEKYNGIERARSIAHRYTKKALAEIDELPDRPEKKVLYMLTKSLFSRTS